MLPSSNTLSEGVAEQAASAVRPPSMIANLVSVFMKRRLRKRRAEPPGRASEIRGRHVVGGDFGAVRRGGDAFDERREGLHGARAGDAGQGLERARHLLRRGETIERIL